MHDATHTTTLTLAAAFLLGAATHSVAGEKINESREAERDGRVTIENLSGSVIVEGWDRAEVQLTGTLADDAEDLEFRTSGSKTRIEVIFPDRSRNLRDVESDLVVKVPFGSEVRVAGVNASIDVSGIEGEVQAESVNGRITISGDPEMIEAENVNGDIRIDSSTSEVAVASVSGDVILIGVGGRVDAATVSGDVEISGGVFESGSFASVSGDIGFDGEPDESASLDFESHSGTIVLLISEDLSAEYEFGTFSGDIDNEFGPRPEKTNKYSPGRELNFTVGDGDALISATTFSGTIRLESR